MVSGCVRRNGSTCERCSNTDNRYLVAESGNYIDILLGAINMYRGNMNVSFNDESGINISSGGPLSVNASGGISISAESVSISAPSRVIAQCGGSYISLEGEFYNEAGGAVAKCGSDRRTYEAFTDDDPQNGVAELEEKAII